MGNDELRYVTLEEMYNNFKTDEYKEFREEFNVCFVKASNGKEEVKCVSTWSLPEFSPILYRHIVAEQLLQTEPYEVNWKYFFIHVEDEYYQLIDLMLNPLVWQDKRIYPHCFIEGRIAQETFDETRCYRVYNIMGYIRNDGILNFADDPFVFKDDLLGADYMKGMHDWGIITADYQKIMNVIRNGKRFEYSYLNSRKYYDWKQLRESLLLIAKYRSGERAAEILRMLQEEWPAIKRCKTNFEGMKNEELSQFEDILLNGFDDLLAEWEGETPSQATEPIKPQKKNSSIGKCKPFDNLLLCSTDEKEKVMARLHELLDDKGGKQVALVLMAAKAKDSLLIDMPTEKQYTTEFSLSGTWRAVSDYIKKHTLITGKYQAEFDHITIL